MRDLENAYEKFRRPNRVRPRFHHPHEYDSFLCTTNTADAQQQLDLLIANHRLGLASLPIATAPTTNISGPAEELILCRPAPKGPQTASYVLHHARRTGVMPYLDRRVIEAAYQRVSETGQLCNVNVDGISLVPELVELVASLEGKANGHAGFVGLEVTERYDLSPEREERLSELASLGLRIYLDDFCTGQSHPTLLGLNSIAGVKFDGRTGYYLRRGDISVQRLIHTTSQLCSERGLALILEGVSSEWFWQKGYEKFGATHGQGSYFGLATNGIPLV